MVDYRIYPLNTEGKIAGGYSFTCANDATAIIYAGTLGFGLSPFEVWCGARCLLPLSVEGVPLLAIGAAPPSEEQPIQRRKALLKETVGPGRVYW